MVEFLKIQGFVAKTSSGIPSLTITLPKKVVEILVSRDDVGAIYLSEGGQFNHFLNSTVSTNMAPTVWGRGFVGSDVDIAILEDHNVDFTSDTSECPVETNNCFLFPGPTQEGISGEDWHVTLVASAAASNHSTYRGMAYGARIMSAGMLGLVQQDSIDALVWAFDHGAEIVNYSAGWCTDTTQMEAIDRAFDYYARSRLRMIVVAAGQFISCPNYNVASPAKGWNILSVGAYDHRNDVNWSNDEIADWSAWVNPSSPNHDHEKPEVVAPGVEVTGIEMNGNLRTASGTSFAAPQVAGLEALLISRNWSLNVWPEASRAIIIASAINNVDGPTGIPSGQDLRDGAGGINAALADTVAQTRNFSDVDPCTDSCWWGIGINNTEFPVGTYLNRYFNASQGDPIRIAISWWSNADCSSISSCNYDRLDTDLHLGVFDPDGQVVPGAWSASYDNNYELVEFSATKTGTYRIGVYKTRADEPNNFLGIAFVRIPPSTEYLPLILKNYSPPTPTPTSTPTNTPWPTQPGGG